MDKNPIVAYAGITIILKDTDETKNILNQLAYVIPSLGFYTENKGDFDATIPAMLKKPLAEIKNYAANFEPNIYQIPYGTDTYERRVFVSYRNGKRKLVLPFVHERSDIVDLMCVGVLPAVFTSLFHENLLAFTIKRGNNYAKAETLKAVSII